MMETGQIICSHNPDEACIRGIDDERTERVYGEPRAEQRLDIRDPDSRMMPGYPLGGRHSLGERCHAVFGLQRILWRDHPPDLAHTELSESVNSHVEMALVGRIERAAHNSNHFPARGREKAAGSWIAYHDEVPVIVPACRRYLSTAASGQPQ